MSSARHNLVVILDFGSQTTQLIARRVREAGVYCEIHPFSLPGDRLAQLQPKAVILSGGPASVYGQDAPTIERDVFDLGVPILGICYGAQLTTKLLGGEVEQAQTREYGAATVRVESATGVLSRFEVGEEVDVWMSHGDRITALPPGFIPAQPGLFAWVASMFMHAGVLHLLGNMLFLWLFATLTEDVFGAWLLLGFYFASDFGASLLHWLVGAMFSPGSLEVPVVGASGAIAGIMGLSAVCFLRTKVRVWYLFRFFLVFVRTGTVELGAPVFVGLWVGWEVVQGLLKTSLEAAYGGGGGVAHWAHIGGFAVGLGGALALKLRKRVVYTDLVGGRRPVTSEFDAFRQAGELENMVKRSPKDADAWHALGRAREASGRVQKAGDAYARALELFLAERRGEEAGAA